MFHGLFEHGRRFNMLERRFYSKCDRICINQPSTYFFKSEIMVVLFSLTEVLSLYFPLDLAL